MLKMDNNISSNNHNNTNNNDTTMSCDQTPTVRAVLRDFLARFEEDSRHDFRSFGAEFMACAFWIHF
jgi:hypothetical protein